MAGHNIRSTIIPSDIFRRLQPTGPKGSCWPGITRMSSKDNKVTKLGPAAVGRCHVASWICRPDEKPGHREVFRGEDRGRV